MSKLNTIIYKPDAKSRFILAGAASAVALEKGYGGTNKSFGPPAKRDRDAYLKYVEVKSTRRTLLIGKRATYGWKL